jgi:hypothetical protein
LWETLQDRLPVKLRLLGIKSIKDANKALPKLIERHNRKHAIPPAEEEAAYMALEQEVNLDYVFAQRTTRKIGGGEAISYKNATYVPAEGRGCNFNAKTVVEVRETFSGEVLIWHNGRAVVLRKIKSPEASPKREEKADTPRISKAPYNPPADHPWRKSSARSSSGCVPGGSAAD